MIGKRLRLQILDINGNVTVTHHFNYDAEDENRLRLTICDNTYIMDKNGKLVILTQKEIGDEQKRQEDERNR
jgi:hypothetical protein